MTYSEVLVTMSLLNSLERILNQFPCRTLYSFSNNDLNDLKKIRLFYESIESKYDFNDFCDFVVINILAVYDQAELDDLKETKLYDLLTNYFGDFLKDPTDFFDFMVYKIVETYHLVPDRISTILNVAANLCLKNKNITFYNAVEKICKDEKLGYLAYEHLDEEMLLAIIDEIATLKDTIIDNDDEITEELSEILFEIMSE